MKKRISILALLCLTLATIAFGVDKLITAPSGDLILDAKTGQKIIIKKEIEAQVQSPGFVPIGGMVAVMPHVSGSWQPPASGSVKDGFMRADGATVTDGDSPLNGEVLPNMASNTYARGDSTSGGSGGSNTQASNVTVGNHTALSLSNHSDINIAHGHGFTNPSVPAHYHSLGSGSAMSVSIDHDHESFNQSMATGTGGAHIHKVVKIQTNNPASSIGLNQTVATIGWGQSSSDYNLSGSVSTPDTGNTSSDTHSHSWTQSINIPNYDVDNRSVSGNVGNTSGSNGNGSFSTTGGGVTDLGETNKSISAHSFSQNIDSHNVTNNAVNNEPKYLSVVWVIRVK